LLLFENFLQLGPFHHVKSSGPDQGGDQPFGHDLSDLLAPEFLFPFLLKVDDRYTGFRSPPALERNGQGKAEGEQNPQKWTYAGHHHTLHFIPPDKEKFS
jgi:hypothetical protein